MPDLRMVRGNRHGCLSIFKGGGSSGRIATEISRSYVTAQFAFAAVKDGIDFIGVSARIRIPKPRFAAHGNLLIRCSVDGARGRRIAVAFVELRVSFDDQLIDVLQLLVETRGEFFTTDRLFLVFALFAHRLELSNRVAI